MASGSAYASPIEEFDRNAIPAFMLARDAETEGVYTDDLTGRPVASVVRYIYEHGDETVVVTFTRERDLAPAQRATDCRG